MAVPASTTGSVGLTSNSSERKSRVTASAASTPTTTPAAASPTDCDDDHSRHLRDLRAQRHANADFPAPLTDDVRDDAVDPDGAEHQRDRPPR